jgi:branched-chain amino acid transport system ATP-binding protein
VIWDSPSDALSQAQLGDLFMTGNGHAHAEGAAAPPASVPMNGKPAL